jgi:hypothetical protein
VVSGIAFTATGTAPTTTTTYTLSNVTGVNCTNPSPTASTSVSVGTLKTWNGTSWSPSAPTSIDAALINTNYSESDDITACSLTISNGAVVSIPTGYNVLLTSEVTVDAGSTFTLENNANLLQESNTATNSGNITVKRFTTPLKRLDYVLWSSPVVGQQLQSFSPGTLATRFYTFNPAGIPQGGSAGDGAYQVITSPSTTTFDAATGYLIRLSDYHPSAPTAWVNGRFTGVPHNGNYSITTTSGSYNAVGNPYPSTIDADTFIDDNGLSDAIYFWRKTNAATGSAYATYTLAGGTTPSPGTLASPTSAIPNGVIQVGQGFIAKATSTSLNFNNGQRVTDNNNQFFRLNNNRSRIWLNLTTADGLFSQAMVAYMPTATNGIDAAIDGRPLENVATELTSIINNEGFVIQGRAPFTSADVVPLRLKAAAAGNYTIAIDHVDGLFTNGQDIFLKDNVANTITNLNVGNYQFATEAGMNDTRFEIVYETTLATTNPTFDANNMVIYKQNDFVVVNTGKTQMSKVKIYDIRGRLLIEEKDINSSEVKINLNNIANQVLIVQVTTTNGTVVSKKVVN